MKGILLFLVILVILLGVGVVSARMFVVAADPNGVSVEFRSNMTIRLVAQEMMYNPDDPNELVITTRLRIGE